MAIIPKLDESDRDNNATTEILPGTETSTKKESVNPLLKWKDINITLPTATSRQVIGYYSGGDRVYLLGGDNVENEFWRLQFNESYKGWNGVNGVDNNLKVIEYQQSFFSSQHDIIYIKMAEYIHIYDMKIEYLNERVIKLPTHLMDGCMTVYYEPNDKTIEYLIIIGSKTKDTSEPTTYIYRVDQKTHNISWFDIGPDLIGERENFCCTVLDNYLYVIGGTYSINTRFVEQWLIDIDTAYNPMDDTEFDNFTNIDTLINTEIANYALPQYGHRCIVNDKKKEIYIIGGITEENGLYFNYSRYVFVLERKNNSLYEMNYRETLEEEEEEMNVFNDNYYGKIIPSLPMEIAYTSPMMDKYGYLNIFGGELNSQKPTNQWLRINTNNDGVFDINNGGDTTDVIWKKHVKHNHNEQWALLILLIMIILIGFWFKCIERISKLRRGPNRMSNARGLYTDGTAYDEISGTSEIDELEEEEDEEQDIDDDGADDGDDDNESDQNYSNLNGIISNHSDLENNAQSLV